MVFCAVPAAAQTGAHFGIMEHATLDFGAVLDEAGRVTLSLTGDHIIDPASIHLGGFHGPGVYRFSGDPHTSFMVEIIPFGGPGLRLMDLQTNHGGGAYLPVCLDEAGQAEIQVGGTLEVHPEKARTGLDQPLHFVISVTWE